MLLVLKWIDEGGFFLSLLLLSPAPLGNAVFAPKVDLVKGAGTAEKSLQSVNAKSCYL